ncbi:MAG: type II toxin-antitoxin system VapC family toxin [Propionibacteriaceae bacterium]|jgi:predicted nucleic acid-binding protein|nr:type II toxin-antitoxin system VapC family toxin [Propionibacteriaceae bacterium]
MIGYFDTSAVVPLVIAEDSSARCAQVWQECDVRVSSVIVVAEAHAALAMALRLGRLSIAQHREAVKLLNCRIAELDLVIVNREIVDKAAALTVQYALRGYDAVHAASVLALADATAVGISGDQALLAALKQLGIATVDTNSSR